MVTGEQLKELCKNIAAIVSNTNDFVKRAHWRGINLDNIKEDIETVRWLVHEIQRLPLDIISEIVIEETYQNLSKIKNILQEIGNFYIKERNGESASWQINISSHFKETLRQVIHTASPRFPLLVLRYGGIDNWTAKAQDAVSDITNMLQSIEGHIEERKKEIDQAVQTARTTAGGAGAKEFTEEFLREAKKARNRSRIWLVVTGALSAFALFIPLAIIFDWFGLGTAPDNPWEALYQFGGRVLVISTLFYIVVWSGRIALANMHLENVNRHRAVSLQTLQAFHEAAENSAVKDAVVLEAARAVYENVPSGYIGRQGTEQSPNTRTVEIIRGANKASRMTTESEPSP